MSAREYLGCTLLGYALCTVIIYFAGGFDDPVRTEPKPLYQCICP